ncbi:sugar transporter STL1 [Plectosphaerella cucumerina]|uniref:Sugar transporter STL1 n=1 Tax=Plectosphaerella cucumerina TaxID=40658 RepID=A0A8K0TQL8_9PEZI|nr:sugar transporter STL1 [Plectosphaerella cucumerina]
MPGRPESRDGEGSSSGRDESVPDGSVGQGASSKAEKPTAQLRDGQIDDVPSNGFLRFFSRMGNLPQWKWRGQLLRGQALNWGIGIIASCGFLMFGYDQGVLSGLLTLDDFQKNLVLMTPLEDSNPLCWNEDGSRDERYCQGDPNTQAAAVAIYQIGCFLGAFLILFYGETWGRRSSTFWGSAIMIIGGIMQAAAFEYGLFVTGRVVGGIGNGMVTSTIPTWQSECARPERRGFLIMISGALISGGIMISYWVVYGFYFLEGQVRWRFPVMFQSFFTIIVMWGLLYLPDSPRWLLMKGRTAEAREVIGRLLDRDEDDPLVEEEISQIATALNVQQKGGYFSRLITRGPSQNLRRTLLGIGAQFMQQICGINLITYYATFVFENSLGFGPQLSRLLAALNGTEYFLASLVALPLIERVGRRKLMLFGAFGMMASMAILAGCASTGVTDENGAPQLSLTFGVTAVVFLFAFNTFFALGWLGMTWLYPAEVTNLQTRIQANALSTCSNWLSNFLIVMITPPAFANLQYRTYIMFAVFNAAIIPSVYFFFPETSKRSLEEIDLYFARAYSEGVSPVKMAKQMPRYTAAELEGELAQYFGDQDMEHRRPSAVATGADVAAPRTA